MHPEQIKAAIRMRDTTPAAIADELHVSKSMVSHVIGGAAKSARIANHIARLVGIPVDTLWPPKPRKSSGLRRMKPEARSPKHGAPESTPGGPA